MSYPHLEFLKGLPESIASVQTGFDGYQRACFRERPPEFFALELCGEAGELGNIEKKAWRGDGIAHDRFAEEAADVLITLMNYCNARGINLGEAVAEKVVELERRRQEKARHHQS